MGKYEIRKLDKNLWALYDTIDDCWLSSMTKDYDKLVRLKLEYEKEYEENPKQMRLDI